MIPSIIDAGVGVLFAPSVTLVPPPFVGRELRGSPAVPGPSSPGRLTAMKAGARHALAPVEPKMSSAELGFFIGGGIGLGLGGLTLGYLTVSPVCFWGECLSPGDTLLISVVIAVVATTLFGGIGALAGHAMDAP
jgi:hypothetical protein